MKTKVLYLISFIIISIPWLFLLEILPISYSRISNAAEVTAEGIMLAANFVVVALLRKELKRLKTAGVSGSRTQRVIGRILFVLASLTLFILGLILVLIAISFSV